MSRIVSAIVRRLPSRERVEEMLFGLRDFERLKTPRESCLTIVCDDGEARDLDIVEVLNKQGVKGVFSVSPDLIGRPGFMTYEHLRAIRKDGHEIAFHGTSNDPFTGFADKNKLLDITLDGVARLLSEGLGTPMTLVYPAGMHDRSVRKLMATLFGCAFTTWFGINEGSTNRYAIRRIPFGAYTGKLPSTDAWYRDIIDRSVNGNCWPTLMLHPGTAEHTSAHNEQLSLLLSYARERQFPVRTAEAHLASSIPRNTGLRVADQTRGN